MEDLFQIGIITGTHGLKGEVKVFPTTDDKERFLDLDTVLIDTGKELIEKKVQYCKFFKQFVFVKFEGLDDINDVEKYKRCPLKVTRENAVPLEEDEYYVADLLGLTIVDESGVTIGELVDVIETGANDVYEVKTSDGGHVLLPAIKDCILDVDMDEKIIAIPYNDPTYNYYTDIEQLPEHIFEEIQHFFSVYKDLENKETDVKDFGGPSEAIAVIEKCIANYEKKYDDKK